MNLKKYIRKIGIFNPGSQTSNYRLTINHDVKLRSKEVSREHNITSHYRSFARLRTVTLPKLNY